MPKQVEADLVRCKRNKYNSAGASTMVVVVAVMLGALMSFAPLASGRVKITLAGVGYGMRTSQVRAILGPPRHKRLERPFPGGKPYGAVWRYPDRLKVEFQRRHGRGPLRVRFVWTKSPKDKGPYGLHVGSTLHRIKNLSNVYCGVYNSEGPPIYLCDWSVTKINKPCGQHLYFSFRMKHHHPRGRVFRIDLTANNGEGC
jgi:hypothetical protein